MKVIRTWILHFSSCGTRFVLMRLTVDWMSGWVNVAPEHQHHIHVAPAPYISFIPDVMPSQVHQGGKYDGGVLASPTPSTNTNQFWTSPVPSCSQTTSYGGSKEWAGISNPLRIQEDRWAFSLKLQIIVWYCYLVKALLDNGDNGYPVDFCVLNDSTCTCLQPSGSNMRTLASKITRIQDLIETKASFFNRAKQTAPRRSGGDPDRIQLLVWFHFDEW
jgi:hypothetical protein